MDDIAAIVLDVVGLVTRGSDAARIEAGSIAAERVRSATPRAVPVAGPPLAAVVQATERTSARHCWWPKIYSWPAHELND
jgi:hypothetical protein